MSEIFAAEELETACEFLRIANERGGYMHCSGVSHIGSLPYLSSLIKNPEDYTHIPKPPKKAVFQMWQNSRDGSIMMQQAGYVGFGYSWKKVGVPFEDVYPEESE